MDHISKFDEETREAIRDSECYTSDEDAKPLLEELRKGIALRVKAKEMKDKSEVMVAEANDLLTPIMVGLDIEKAKIPFVGTLTMKTNGKKNSFLKKKAFEYLVTHGVKPELVKKAEKHATKSETVPYQLTFRA